MDRIIGDADGWYGSEPVRLRFKAFQTSSHASQRQYVLVVITFASVPIAVERQNGQASGRSPGCSEPVTGFIEDPNCITRSVGRRNRRERR